MSEQRHPEGVTPFDQEDQADSRGQVTDGDYPLRKGEVVQPDDVRPTRKVASKRSRRSGSRRVLDRVAPPASKRRKGLATGLAIGAGVGGTVGGGAEWVGYQLGKLTPGGSSLSAEHSPYGVEGVTVDDARKGTERNRREHAASEAAREASAGQSGEVDVSEAGVTGYVELDSETPDDTTTVVTGGVSADRDPGTGGVSAGDSAG